MKLRYILIATGLGLGFSPKAPGTMGALGGCLIAAAISLCSSWYNVWIALLIAIFIPVGVYCSDKVETDWGQDPSKIVIDEIVGMWIALLALPAGWSYMLAAFILFRFFDIAKPFYIKRMEKLRGGWGVMMDDVLAGIYANVAIQLFCLAREWF